MSEIKDYQKINLHIPRVLNKENYKYTYNISIFFRHVSFFTRYRYRPIYVEARMIVR